MIHYLYKTVHVNGKYYVGRHSTTKLNDRYLGSGKWPRSIKNKKELAKEILSYHNSIEELKLAEEQLLAEHVGKPLCMNFNNNSVGFASGDLNPAKTEKEKLRKSKLTGEANHMFGKSHSEESRKKMSASRKGRKAWNKDLTGIKTSSKGQVAWNKGIKTGYQSFTGKSHSEESIERMKKSHANRETLTCYHCGKTLDKPNYTRYHGDKCKLFKR